MRPQHYLLPALVLFAGALGWYFLSPGAIPQDIDWHETIRTEGASKAYTLLSKKLASVDESDQHLEAHLFGSALYEEEGLGGFLVCDQNFNGGCGHEFMAEAIADLGLPVLTTLNQSCLDRFGERGATSCQHGFGHGLVSYFGYDKGKLLQALDQCDSLHTLDSRKGCRGGAFMEYNLRTVADNMPRPFDGSEAASFCTSLPQTYQADCVFWIPQWMLTSKYPGQRDENAFRGVGDYCTQHAFPEDCFGGLGYFATPFASYDATKTRAFCEAASENPLYQEHCWSVAREGIPPSE